MQQHLRPSLSRGNLPRAQGDEDRQILRYLPNFPLDIWRDVDVLVTGSLVTAGLVGIMWVRLHGFFRRWSNNNGPVTDLRGGFRWYPPGWEVAGWLPPHCHRFFVITDKPTLRRGVRIESAGPLGLRGQ